MPRALQRPRPHIDRLLCPFQTDEQGHPGRRCLDVQATTRRFHIGEPFERGDKSAGILKGDAIFQGDLVVAFSGRLTGVFGVIHSGVVGFNGHLRNSAKIVNLGAENGCN